MNRVTAEALEASIKHWDENANAKTPADASTRARDCALCVAFPDTDDRGCPGCPVHEFTGGECKGTPYYAANGALFRWRDHPDRETEAAHFRLTAIRERDFLISLREPIEEDDANG